MLANPPSIEVIEGSFEFVFVVVLFIRPLAERAHTTDPRQKSENTRIRK